MTRRISAFPGALDLIFPGMHRSPDKTPARLAPDPWRPERRHRASKPARHRHEDPASRET